MPGSTLSFQVSLTTAVDAAGTPDEFSFAILHRTLNSTLVEIPTFGLGNALLALLVGKPHPTGFAGEPKNDS